MIAYQSVTFRNKRDYSTHRLLRAIQKIPYSVSYHKMNKRPMMRFSVPQVRLGSALQGMNCG